MNLPIESVLPELKNALRNHSNAVLVAAPGAGKSTRVPLALLGEPWLEGRKIVMLEPRRVAARSIAGYMASLLNERAGGTVGYRVRMDTRVSAGTRIEVVTEGVLTRMLQEDPTLEGIGAVLFDEFHERSVHSDLGLALCLQTQSLIREDLRLLVMSATMDAEAVSRMMDGAPVIRSEGRSFPVETRYAGSHPAERMEEAAAEAVMRAVKEEDGHILVFLPGAREIRRTRERLRPLLAGQNVEIAELHGSLAPEEQDRAIAPPTPHVRKIVLASAIAETSLTVEGVRIVIDSGWARVPRFSPRTGLTRLETVRVSLASADQRRGRAGRLGPGVCYRLWSQEEERRFPAYREPEIMEADLSSLALELAAWGTADPAELKWLDPPPAASYHQAVELLKWLGALDGQGKITAHGRNMCRIGLPPRLAHMVIRSREYGWEDLACLMACVLQERDFLTSREGGSVDADLRLRMEALLALRAGRSPQIGQYGVVQARTHRILAEAEHLRAAAAEANPGAGRTEADPMAEADDLCGILLAFAYPDRIAKRRGHGYLLANGRGAYLPPGQAMAREEWIVAAELDGSAPESRIVRAAPVAWRDLEKVCSGQIEETKVTEWDPSSQSVRSVIRLKLGAIPVREQPNPEPQPEAVLQALLDGIGQEGLDILPWTKAARQFQRRNMWMRRMRKDWPDLSDETLGRTLPEWLGPYLYGIRGKEELRRIQLLPILEGMLSREQRLELDRFVPTHWTVPSGSRIPIDYAPEDSPVLAVRLQEMFGSAETPAILNGKVQLTLHLLSPAGRPVQITRDLASFWQHAYFEVKKDLKGRYPKHYWPDDPMQAVPANRAKPGK